MKKLVAENITLGPFHAIAEGDDRYIADGIEIPFAMLVAPVLVDVADYANNSVPQAVTMRQARLALLSANLLANVQAAINSLPEPDKTKAQIEWEYSNALERNNSFVATLGAALGLNSAAIDALFIQAAQL